MRAGWLVVAFLVGVAASVPPTSAQGPPPSFSYAVSGTNHSVQPESGPARFEITVRIGCDHTESPLTPTQIRFWVKEAPPYASTVIHPSVIVPTFNPNDCVPGSEPSYKASMEVSISREAPAFQDGRYGVQVNISKGVSNEYKHLILISAKNGYLAHVNVNPWYISQTADRDKKVTFPVEVTNLGNGPTKVKIELIPSTGLKLASYDAGGEIRLASKAGKLNEPSAKAGRNIEVTTPSAEGISTFKARFYATYRARGPDDRRDHARIHGPSQP